MVCSGTVLGQVSVCVWGAIHCSPHDNGKCIEADMTYILCKLFFYLVNFSIFVV